jgi:hypothetical protein
LVLVSCPIVVVSRSVVVVEVGSDSGE